ncbi:MAG: hypothetical protein ACRC67_18125 [Inquilinus sp.]|uniref:hypothetical protein n=1 Tax=Inquilinus sp. TaxID=1932117 RepID=UPI003F3C470C
MYEYVTRAYDVRPIVGDRVRHSTTGGFGVIAPECPSAGHYVQVRFDGNNCAMPCHPTELDYLGPLTPAAGGIA